MASKKKAVDATMLTGAVIGSLVLINILGITVFHRFDLTRNGEFTLSKATRDTLNSLTDPVTVTAYFTKDLPPPYSTNARYVRDLLEEYYAHSHGNFHYEFIDPTSEETDADKEKKKEVRHDIFGQVIREETSVERELKEAGIQTVQVRVNQDDKIEVKRGYMGILLRYGDKKEVIPMVAETSGLEYDLTTSLRKLTRDKTPKVALITGHDNPDPQKDMAKLYGLLGQLYDVTTIDLTKTPKIPDDVSAILVIAPKTPLSEAEQREIDSFVMSGRSAAFLVGEVSPELKTLQADPIDSGLTSLLASYGVKLEPGVVLDKECAMINVSRQQGFMQISQPVHYPFVLTPKRLSDKHPLTRGLTGVSFPFMSPLKTDIPSDSGVKAEALVESSSDSWVQSAPYNLDPFQQWTRDQMKDVGSKDVVVALSGPLKSPFAVSSEDVAVAKKDARVLVAGGYAFLLDDFFGQKGNQALAMNLFDWLVQDDALLAVRTRGLAAAPIDDSISDTHRNTLKYMNILGLPLAFVGFGVFRWRMREGRRTRVSL